MINDKINSNNNNNDDDDNNINIISKGSIITKHIPTPTVRTKFLKQTISKLNMIPRITPRVPTG